MIEVNIPEIGETISEVTISEWIKSDGDWVERDEVICEIESEKATLEVPAEQSGILRIVAKEGDDVKVGEPFYKIEQNGKTKPTETIVEKETTKIQGEINIPLKKEKLSDVESNSLNIDEEYILSFKEGEKKVLHVKVFRKYLNSYLFYVTNYNYYTKITVYDLHHLWEIKEGEKNTLKKVAEKIKDRDLFPRKAEEAKKLLNNIEMKKLTCKIRKNSEGFGSFLPTELDDVTYQHIRNMSLCYGIELNGGMFTGDISLLQRFENTLRMFSIEVVVEYEEVN